MGKLTLKQFLSKKPKIGDVLYQQLSPPEKFAISLATLAYPGRHPVRRFAVRPEKLNATQHKHINRWMYEFHAGHAGARFPDLGKVILAYNRLIREWRDAR